MPVDNSSITFEFPAEIGQLSNEITDHSSLYKYSIENRELFWSTLARNRLEWISDFNEITSGDFKDPEARIKWFIDGKINVAVNCVDRHYLKNPSKIALIWEKDEPGCQEYVTYEQLYKLMNQIANTFRAYNVKKGDRVAIYLPCCTMAVATMLACARIGAIHSVIFAGFSADSLASRMNDSLCTVVVTSNQGVRAGKVIELKKTVDTAVAKCPTIEHVFVMQRTDAPMNLGAKDINLNEEIAKQETECAPEVMDSEDPLFMLYTSGSTGKPKGLIHTQAGYLLYAAMTQKLVFDYNENDVFGCLADVGWITGHSYVVYGPLCNGGTTVLFESSPIYPNPGRYWETVQRLKINQLYLAPTAIRLLLKYDDEHVTKYDRSSLRVLGSVGEPINREAWEWYYNLVGEKRCKIADTWWQTETGGHCISPIPANRDDIIKPSMAMRPFFGIVPALVDEKTGEKKESKNSQGVLCIQKTWPGMARTIYGDHERFLNTYMRPYPGFYFSGDGALTDEQGYFQITGRVDDVINVSGHRIGTAEIEDALNEHINVAESAVVSYPHDIVGEGIYAYITLKENVTEDEAQLIKELKGMVKLKIAHYAIPHCFLVTSDLPKTRSGKIMRRVLRKIASNNFDELGDISTLGNPAIVEHIIEKHKSSHEVKN